MAFRVGQKVVCVDAAPRTYNDPGLKAGAIYTIEGFAREHPVRKVTGLYLAGLNSFRPQMSEDWGYYPDRFRPLVERKTELPACITALLDPANHELVKEPV